MSNYEQFRRSKDQFFSDHPQSPLTPNQRGQFPGLDYFPGNPALDLHIEAVPFPDPEDYTMQTSTGDEQHYKRYAQVSFEVDGQQAELTIFASPHGFFLPFVDALAGEETYPAGRYLDPELTPDGTFHIDFNLAYNPYCAYNDIYSCPLTPFENRLKVGISAARSCRFRAGQNECAPRLSTLGSDGTDHNHPCGLWGQRCRRPLG